MPIQKPAGRRRGRLFLFLCEPGELREGGVENAAAFRGTIANKTIQLIPTYGAFFEQGTRLLLLHTVSLHFCP